MKSFPKPKLKVSRENWVAIYWLDKYGFQGHGVCFRQDHYAGVRKGANIYLVFVSSPDPLKESGFEEERKGEKIGYLRAMRNPFGDCTGEDRVDQAMAAKFHGLVCGLDPVEGEGLDVVRKFYMGFFQDEFAGSWMEAYQLWNSGISFIDLLHPSSGAKQGVGCSCGPPFILLCVCYVRCLLGNVKGKWVGL